MAAKNKPKPKHIPQRTCVGCREVLPKRTLIRLVRTEEGIRIDLSGKLPGRGAYLCESMSCFEQAYKAKRLERSLKHSVSKEIYEALQRDLQENE